ncbi:MAG: CBS domain-containing protein [Candidatus Binatia bacterium]
MLVRAKMTANPITVTPQDLIATAQTRMRTGDFSRVPVVENDKLVGILTDRDIRLYEGLEKHTKVKAVMTEQPLTISAQSTVEEAAALLLQHKIGGLPVIDGQQLVGVITTTDILQAFLDSSGATDTTSTRIDFMQKGGPPDVAEACRLVQEQHGEVLGVGTYPDPWSGQPISYLRFRAPEPDLIAEALRTKGYAVLSVQKHHAENRA